MLKLRHETGDGADHFQVYTGQVRIGTIYKTSGNPTGNQWFGASGTYILHNTAYIRTSLTAAPCQASVAESSVALPPVKKGSASNANHFVSEW
jgi:hypothetical protein